MENVDVQTENIIKEETKIQPPLCLLNILELKDESITTIPLDRKDLIQIASGKRPDILSQKEIYNLARIEHKAFGEGNLTEYYLSEEELKYLISEMSGPQFLIRENGRIVGYLATRPAVDAYDEFANTGLLRQDPDFRRDTKALYLESIAGTIGTIKTGMKILKLLEDQALQYGYDKLCCHGINPRLNKVMMRFGGFKKIRDLPHWLDTKAVYMEKHIQKRE